MKKWIAVLLVLAMCLALCACGGKSKDDAELLPAGNDTQTEDTVVTSGSDLQPNTSTGTSSGSDLEPVTGTSSSSDLQP